MAQDTAEQEPTMEEILASIRRIINEDEEEKPAAETAETASEPEPAPEMEAEPEAAMEAEPAPEPEPAPVVDPAPEPQPDFEDDVLELTDRVEDDAVAGGTAPLAVSDDLMIVDREDEPEPEAEPEPAPEPAPVQAAAPEPAPGPEDDSLLDEAPASAASSMFAALSENLRVSSEQGQTLEGIVRELMRPMLKQWLDENLPAIVEEKVQAEVDRIARRRR
ncbi:DUF2497 domain-containing protein [Alkalicaulis satelles]|uniref:DUF2497 domain-containing protein n=1 Tax=Alkalicaulis satelles TaxID=2609175 RepID=A0A5M6ZIG2_9PROT|nr:DUF2497 domain-containing protein [Alkalicaulis satelles]KAA5804613.1 DUF2497 domain-containing protein [Alkalicaulis satelles]